MSEKNENKNSTVKNCAAIEGISLAGEAVAGLGIRVVERVSEIDISGAAEETASVVAEGAAVVAGAVAEGAATVACAVAEGAAAVAGGIIENIFDGV
jgi:hypothetical protein